MAYFGNNESPTLRGFRAKRQINARIHLHRRGSSSPKTNPKTAPRDSKKIALAINQGGQRTIRFFGHKQFDASNGIFIYRQWGEEMPETTSHERYNPNTRTFYSESLPATPPTGIKMTAITKRIGNDKMQQKLEVREGGRLVYSHEIVSIRIGENQD